jgi:hypothetical protein
VEEPGSNPTWNEERFVERAGSSQALNEEGLEEGFVEERRFSSASAEEND